MGFRVVERLILKDAGIPFDSSAVVPGHLTGEILVREICSYCPFYDDDCDFVKGKESSAPCGGFILLEHLLEAKVIAIDNIRDVR
jgi:hypothetical protein